VRYHSKVNEIGLEEFLITTICLVRHGETDWNKSGILQGWTDIPLNETGIRQAEECAEYLKDSHWDLIITSTLKRAKQTAEIINNRLDTPIIEMKEFRERYFGDAEGMNPLEREFAFPDRCYPNQEDQKVFKTRVMEGIHFIQRNYTNQKILLVAHGAVINAILAKLSDDAIGSGKTNLLNACISNIHFTDSKWRIKDYNRVSHLSKR
jgi:uncharacterized phosphatase